MPSESTSLSRRLLLRAIICTWRDLKNKSKARSNQIYKIQKFRKIQLSKGAISCWRSSISLNKSIRRGLRNLDIFLTNKKYIELSSLWLKSLKVSKPLNKEIQTA